MKYCVLALLMAIGGEGILYGQSSTNSSPVDPQQIEMGVTFTAPEVASLGRFAMQPPNYSNGAPQQSIPVFTIKENGIDFPISLNYTYNGFQPRQPATNVGLGWVMTEGVITRVVKSLPDDNPSLYKKFDSFNYFNLAASWEWGEGTPDQNALNANNGVTPMYDLTANRIYNKLYDGQPDVYIFNFNGHTGRFLFLKDTAYVYPYGDYHIVKSGSNFVISTPDGMDYTFQPMDWTMSWNYNADKNAMTPDSYALECGGGSDFLSYSGGTTTTSWRLIKAVNKATHSTLNFSYASYSVTQEKRELSAFTFWSDPQITSNLYVHSQFQNVINPDPTLTQSVYYYLTGIGSDHDSIMIQTQGRTDFDPSSNAKAISEIDIYSKSNLTSPARSVKLNHGYFNDGSSNTWNYQWLSLNSVVVSGGGESKEYDFTYNLAETGLRGYPNLSQETYGLDHWGYYNGIYNQYLVPQSWVTNLVDSDQGFAPYIMSTTPWADRDPDFDYAKVFALTQVKYPTGGYSNIVYESAGGRGIRVRSTEDNDGVNSYKKFYTYYPDDPVPAPVYNYSDYTMDVVVTQRTCVPGIGYPIAYLTVTGAPHSTLDFFDETNNFYSQVTEYIGTSDGQGGHNVYNYFQDQTSFTPFLTETDQYKYGGSTPVKKTVNTYVTQPIRQIQYWSDPAVTVQGNCMTCYGSADYTVAAEFYSPYDAPPGFGWGYLLSVADVQPYELGLNWYQLTQTDQYNYADDGSSNDNVSKFHYNSLNPSTSYPKNVYPISVDHTLSNGKTRTLQEYYAGDADPDNPGAELGTPEMWDPTNANYKYYTAPVIKTKTLVNFSLQSYDLNTYTYNSSTDELLLSANEKHPNGSTIKLSWNYAYDSHSNLVGTSMQNDIVTSYIWDYGSWLAIAKCVNADPGSIAFTSFEADGTGGWSVGSPTRYTTGGLTGNNYYLLNSDISRSGLNSGTSYVVSYWTQNSSSFTVPGTISGYPVKGKTVMINNANWTYYEHKVTGQSTISLAGSGYIDELRLYPSNAQMTTYTYAPLVGITSECDADNRVTYFEYDNFGRLARIRDQDKNITKQYDYQYKVSATAFTNTVESASFTRNNCSIGLTPGSVTYTVPAGKYSSEISQADANQQATTDVNVNGQNYANGNAACYFTSAQESGNFTRNNCAAGGSPSSVSYVVAAGTYRSTLSQTDADQQAINDVNANGQNYANVNASCTFQSAVESGTFTRNNCSAGGSPSNVTYTVPAGRYSSTTSQAAANTLAQNDVNTNGQAYANSSGTCTFYNAAASGTYTRNNCGAGYTGGPGTYTVAAGTYSSTTSQSAANTLAQNDVNANGQNYVNSNGPCTLGVYVRLEKTDNYSYSDAYYSEVSTDYHVRVYGNAACTQPVTLPDDVTLNVNYHYTTQEVIYPWGNTYNYADDDVFPVQGQDYDAGFTDLSYCEFDPSTPGYSDCTTESYTLTPGSYYTIEN